MKYIFGSLFAFAVMFGSAQATVSTNVTICHSTGSGWTKITVDADAVNGSGGGDHNSSSHMSGKDIIPPGFWDFNGRNWDATGQATYNNNCVVPPPPPVDVCANIPEVQVTIPEGYESLSEGQCTLIPPPPVDVCSNIDGNQSTVPEGYSESEGICTEIPDEPTDVCSNIDGNQETVPEGYSESDGICTETSDDNGGGDDEPTDEPENSDEPEQRSSGGGSSNRLCPPGGPRTYAPSLQLCNTPIGGGSSTGGSTGGSSVTTPAPIYVPLNALPPTGYGIWDMIMDYQFVIATLVGLLGATGVVMFLNRKKA